MKKMLSLLLALVMLCISLAALAEEGETVTLELNAGKLPVYAADDPYLNGLTSAGDGLPVIVLAVKKNVQLQVNVLPKTTKNKKVELAVDNEAVVRVKGNTVSGLAPGETVLTITSVQDSSVAIQYRIVVIQPVTRLTLTAPAKSVAIGGTIQLTPVYAPENATRQQVTWVSANEQIATVDENGVVTGLKRGTARITATAADGSNIRANISVQVTQSAEEITLDKPELTIDVGRNAVVKATVLPKDTNNKKVVWSSSDESIATVDKQGRIKAVALGDCEITCASEEIGTVQAKAVVHVQQPVKKVTFSPAPAVYNDETAQLTWTIEPENASNPKLTFVSSNEKILTVDENGVVTGVSGGEATVTATTTDGSRRQAKIKVKVMQHLTGVHMLRKTAYIDYGQTSSAGAILEPERAKNVNPNMTWESANPSVASVAQNKKAPNKVDITGVAYGDTEVYGTTEDGGFRTSIKVKVGDWENSLKWVEGKFDARCNLCFAVKNVSELNITSITLVMECFDFDGNPEPVNKRNGSNTVKVVYNKPLGPGRTTPEDGWKPVDYDRDLVIAEGIGAIRARIAEFVIEGDWVKTVRSGNRQMKITYNPHGVLH
ncbi:MAG: Ig-like domain-containing protein [Clostridia bacterium]|nr:Ig-like domain-containing protein [Clostridia bacterium]